MKNQVTPLATVSNIGSRDMLAACKLFSVVSYDFAISYTYTSFLFWHNKGAASNQVDQIANMYDAYANQACCSGSTPKCGSNPKDLYSALETLKPDGTRMVIRLNNN